MMKKRHKISWIREPDKANSLASAYSSDIFFSVSNSNSLPCQPMLRMNCFAQMKGLQIRQKFTQEQMISNLLYIYLFMVMFHDE